MRIIYITLLLFHTDGHNNLNGQDSLFQQIIVPKSISWKILFRETQNDTIIEHRYSNEDVFILNSDNSFYHFSVCFYSSNLNNIVSVSLGDGGHIFKGNYFVDDSIYIMNGKLSDKWYSSIPDDYTNCDKLYTSSSDTIFYYNDNIFIPYNVWTYKFTDTWLSRFKCGHVGNILKK